MFLLGIWFAILGAAVMIVAAAIGQNVLRQWQMIVEERDALAVKRQELEAWEVRLSAVTAAPPPAQPPSYCIVGEKALWPPDDDADLPSDTGSAALVVYRRG